VKAEPLPLLPLPFLIFPVHGRDSSKDEEGKLWTIVKRENKKKINAKNCDFYLT